MTNKIIDKRQKYIIEGSMVFTISNISHLIEDYLYNKDINKEQLCDKLILHCSILSSLFADNLINMPPIISRFITFFRDKRDIKNLEQLDKLTLDDIKDKDIEDFKIYISNIKQRRDKLDDIFKTDI